MYAMLGMDSQKTFTMVTKGNNEKTRGEATLVLSIQDYADLDISDNEKMTVYEFTAFYKRVSKDQDPRGARTLAQIGKEVHQNNDIHLDTFIAIDVDSNSNNATKDIDTAIDEDINTNMNAKHECQSQKKNAKAGGRPMHTRLAFKPTHKLAQMHHTSGRKNARPISSGPVLPITTQKQWHRDRGRQRTIRTIHIGHFPPVECNNEQQMQSRHNMLVVLGLTQVLG